MKTQRITRETGSEGRRAKKRGEAEDCEENQEQEQVHEVAGPNLSESVCELVLGKGQKEMKTCMYIKRVSK